MNAENLTINTSGNSSAAIRSDRGGGTVTVTGGSYTTSGTGSPVIYSTADITVNNAEMESTASQGVVVEGKNSVTLNNVELTADNNTKNSDKSDYYQAVMIYQSMSGDADEGTSSFTMNGGRLTNANGDIFFVNNTATTIDLTGAEIINNGDGIFLRAAAAGWGSEGSNGGHVNMTAADQEINGDMATVSEGATPISDPAHGYCVIRTLPVSSLAGLYGGIRGYVYLGVGGGSKSNATGTAKNGTGYYKVDADGSNLNMRSSDRASASILGKVPDNTRVYVSDISNGMGKIVYNGLTGWVQLSWITKA